MKVAQHNESNGRYVASSITVKDQFLNRGNSDFRGNVTFKNDVHFKGKVYGLNQSHDAPTKLLYCDSCPSSQYPPPIASTFGIPFIANDNGTYRFHVEIAFLQNTKSEHTAFMVADFYINGNPMHEKAPESYERFILTRTMTLKKEDRVELRICEDFFSGTTYVLDPSASYYEIVSL